MDKSSWQKMVREGSRVGWKYCGAVVVVAVSSAAQGITGGINVHYW